MIEFGGIFYYIDINELEKATTPVGYSPKDKAISTQITTTKDGAGNVIEINEIQYITQQRREINATKYDILKTMIDVMLDYNEESDTSLGSDRALERTPLSYKLAFNTLYNYGVLKEKE